MTATTDSATGKAENLGPVAAAKKEQTEAHGARVHRGCRMREIGVRCTVEKVSNEATTPVVPRPASTVLIVRDDPFEVLLVLRSAGNDFFPAAYVFPGGRVEEHDRSEHWLPLIEHSGELSEEERGFRIAAVRETHEEASILLADGLDSAPEDGKVDGSSGRVVHVPPPAPDALGFQQLIAQLGARLLLDEVVPYAHWVTPPQAPKRFDTRFYLTRAPEGQLAVADQFETDDTLWISPAEAIERALAGSLALPPPTFINLGLLAQSSDSAQALAASRQRTVVTIHPQAERLEDGALRMHIPIEAGYGSDHYVIPADSAMAELRPRTD